MMVIPTSSKISRVNRALDQSSALTDLPEIFLHNHDKQLALKQVEDLIDGIVILTEEKQLIYANDGALRVLSHFSQDKAQVSLLPQEIWHICQSLICSRNLFPNQHWLIESEILTNDSTVFHIRVRWLNLDAEEQRCLLLTLEDRHQVIQNIAIDEAQKYRLTAREKEVWLLHRANYTYKQIALALNITPNTVKKHMRSIHAKQKETAY